ncbi:SET domain-containing protein [Coniochaeta ligniaria NRRL 30616]|uniref:SET domain-containing protein n=1 Tax=Coniochaeta ligniaria NRRL 30616 TaxID=1408157 RepID=A0A1J7ILT5_9PEZI|nr:SET domain-containing protein [Coniochaeta ligniaria NRRL 30616]
MLRSDPSALEVASKLRGVTFQDVECGSVDGKGWGLTATRNLTTTDVNTGDVPKLITIPHDLVLNQQTVEEYAKESREFRELYEAVGRQSARRDVLLFLLVQLARGNPDLPSGTRVVSHSWTEYLRFLPEDVLVPTQWSTDERKLLDGTSLKAALTAKLSSLTSEFDFVFDKSCNLPFWYSVLWETEPRRVQDWIMLDAWYRSRCLELPRSGVSMVPYLDMVNHSSKPTAYYDEDSKDEVVLLLRPGTSVAKGEEITISYGTDKPAAEMLFSYGFLEPTEKGGSLVLPFGVDRDDPLARAKLMAFGEPPKVHVSVDRDGVATWECPFAYLSCLNEEDGLEFRLLQDVEGNRELRVFWLEEDVTDRSKDFEAVLRDHAIYALVRLRAVTILQGCLQEELQQLQSQAYYDSLSSDPAVRKYCKVAAAALREIEAGILETVVDAMQKEQAALVADENVVAYFGSMETAESDLVGDEAANEEEDEDFS